MTRPMPWSNEAERGFLGAVLCATSQAEQAEWLAMVGPLDFFGELHRRLFEGIVKLNKRGPVDTFVLCTSLVRSSSPQKDELQRIAQELGDDPPSAFTLPGLAQELRELSRRRSLMEWASRVYEGAAADTPLDVVEKHISAVPADALATAEGRWHDPVKTARDVVAAAHAAYEAGGNMRGEYFPVGLECVDDVVTLKRGELAVVCGRTSMGKSALAQQWAANCARAGFSVVYMSFEMPAEMLFQRHAAQRFGVNFKALGQRRPTVHELRDIEEAAGEWAGMGIRVDDRGGPTMDEIQRALRAAHRQRPVDVVVLDHMGLIAGAGKKYEIATAVAHASLALAKELNCGVILVSQLNRAHAGRTGSDAGLPRLSDLRDSGSIEEDANVVLGVYRPRHDDPETQAPDVICVLKNRSGESGGRLRTRFNGPRQLWELDDGSHYVEEVWNG